MLKAEPVVPDKYGNDLITISTDNNRENFPCKKHS